MPKRVRLPATVRRISIRNYKGIDEVDLQLPGPRMKEDPDVMVIGSENGLGKTSILECCSLLLSTLTISRKQFDIADPRYSSINLPDLLIRAGAERFELDGDISIGESNYSLSFHVTRTGTAWVGGEDLDRARKSFRVNGKNRRVSRDLIDSISGLSADPVVVESFLLFHSYRKVREGNPELGMMADDRSFRPVPWRRRFDFPASHFKITILRSLMQRADLFELSDVEDSDIAIDRLNNLLKFYAGGTISKLRPSADNTVDFRISPEGEGESFTFDGLSSGQKEIISTLFLVWYHTKDRPSVVLIDEPELHLNAQWHRSFVSRLFELAPRNQYIVATHSVDVMDSVEEDRRVILSS